MNDIPTTPIVRDTNAAPANAPAELTRLIEPIERHLIDRLEHSLKFQTERLAEAQECVNRGQSACHTEPMRCLHQLSHDHVELLELHVLVSKIGDHLQKLSRRDNACYTDELEPF